MGGSYDKNPTIIDTAILIPYKNSIEGFITRMDSLGNMKWIKSYYGHSGFNGIGSISTENNNIYVTGILSDTINLGGYTLSNKGQDILIAKFDENGNLIWARQTFLSGASNGIGSGAYILTDTNGFSYITGNFGGSAMFGNFKISTSNSYDMFLTRYNSIGDCLGVIHFGQALGSSLSVDKSGNVICTGDFDNTVNIGDSTFTNNGIQDIFVAKTSIITGIIEKKLNTNNQLLIYANPNAGKCTIDIPDDFLKEKNLTLSVYDNTAKLIQKKTLEMNNEKIKLDLDAEAKGIYNAVLSNGKKSYSGKIVFQ